MIFVIRVSRWFRFKLWLSVKCLQLANWMIRRTPEMRGAPVPLTPEQVQSIERDMLNYTSDVRH